MIEFSEISQIKQETSKENYDESKGNEDEENKYLEGSSEMGDAKGKNRDRECF